MPIIGGGCIHGGSCIDGGSCIGRVGCVGGRRVGLFAIDGGRLHIIAGLRIGCGDGVSTTRGEQPARAESAGDC